MTLGPTVENFLCELVPLQLSQGASGHPFQLTTEVNFFYYGKNLEWQKNIHLKVQNIFAI